MMRQMLLSAANARSASDFILAVGKQRHEAKKKIEWIITPCGAGNRMYGIHHSREKKKILELAPVYGLFLDPGFPEWWPVADHKIPQNLAYWLRSQLGYYTVQNVEFHPKKTTWLAAHLTPMYLLFKKNPENTREIQEALPVI